MRELSLNVLDIAQNSISAGASRIGIAVEENTGAGTLHISIRDNGRGMTKEQLSRVGDPFFTTGTTHKAGLGVPLFQMAAEMTGGELVVSSAPGKGAEVRAGFYTGHLDMAPLGDVEETVWALIAANPGLDFIYTRSRDGKAFTLDTRELRGILGEEAALGHPEVIAWIKDYLAEQAAALTRDPST